MLRTSEIAVALAIGALGLGGLTGLAPRAHAAPPTCHGKPATIVVTGTNDVTGTNGPDVIVVSSPVTVDAAGGHDDICARGGGADTVLGGDGNDWISGSFDHGAGGPGNDRIIASRVSLDIFGGDGNDYIRSVGTVYTTSGDAGKDEIVGVNDLNVLGGAGNDRLIGRGVGGGLNGGPGNDTLSAPRTGDGFILWASPGNDRFHAHNNPATLVNYYFAPTGVRVNLTTGRASGWGRDRLYGVRSAAGSHHPDVLIGNKYANVLRGLVWPWDFGDDPATAGPDVVTGRGGNDNIIAIGPGTVARGGKGSDKIEVSGRGYGGRGNDTLLGGYDTDDLLVGNSGRDSADGATGVDTCVAETVVNCER